MSGAARERRRQRSLHCPPEEQAMIRGRAKAAGKTISRYVLDLALQDDPDVHPVVIDEEAQLSLLEGMLEVLGVVRLLREELPGGSGQSLLSAISAMAGERAA
ncbi:MAG: hypothetical protein F4X97_08550 [Boseongicola sp. SB0662_bin_57]|nr:hypothetical protein [Boseongicola sp. SB0662_bin_57]